MPPPPPAAPPWQGEAPARERPRVDAQEEPEAAPEAPRRRNLMFATTSRKERERAQAKAFDNRASDNKASDSKAADGLPPPVEPVAPAVPELPPASFDDAWPKPDRGRIPEPVVARRPPPRAPSTFEPAVPPPEPAAAEEPAVTVLKSGVVDGMAYSLYSDGSIEAQMPEGMMRFASIDELRAHLDQRA
jgi:hypothetical protein